MTTKSTLLVVQRLERRLKQRLSGRSEGESLDPHLDLTPLQVALLALDVEDATQIRIPVTELSAMRTLDDFLRALWEHVTVNDALEAENALAIPDTFESIARHMVSAFTGRAAHEIRPSDRLDHDLNIDWMAMAKFFVRLEKIACTEIPTSTLQCVYTVRDLTHALRALLDAPPATERLDRRNS